MDRLGGLSTLNKGSDMTTTDYARFLTACICVDSNLDEGLAGDELYGVYISWCLLQGERPEASEAFWAAMRELGIGDHRRASRRFIRPGLRMTGPAAVDYILARRPVFV
jgi:hypothetical protein